MSHRISEFFKNIYNNIKRKDKDYEKVSDDISLISRLYLSFLYAYDNNVFFSLSNPEKDPYWIHAVLFIYFSRKVARKTDNIIDRLWKVPLVILFEFFLALVVIITYTVLIVLNIIISSITIFTVGSVLLICILTSIILYVLMNIICCCIPCYLIFFDKQKKQIETISNEEEMIEFIAAETIIDKIDKLLFTFLFHIISFVCNRPIRKDHIINEIKTLSWIEFIKLFFIIPLFMIRLIIYSMKKLIYCMRSFFETTDKDCLIECFLKSTFTVCCVFPIAIFVILLLLGTAILLIGSGLWIIYSFVITITS